MTIEYEWQTVTLERKVKKIMQLVNENRHFPMKVIGIAVAHPDKVEGAMYLFPDQFDGIAWADVVQDVLGDTTAEYQAAVQSLTDAWEAARSWRDK